MRFFVAFLLVLGQQAHCQDKCISEVWPWGWSREGFYDLELISAHAWRGTQTNSQDSSGGISREGYREGNGGQISDFFKKMDPSRSPVIVNRSELKCYIEYVVYRLFLRPQGSKIIKK